jgi:hypothetical protein
VLRLRAGDVRRSGSSVPGDHQDQAVQRLRHPPRVPSMSPRRRGLRATSICGPFATPTIRTHACRGLPASCFALPGRAVKADHAHFFPRSSRAAVCKSSGLIKMRNLQLTWSTLASRSSTTALRVARSWVGAPSNAANRRAKGSSPGRKVPAAPRSAALAHPGGNPAPERKPPDLGPGPRPSPWAPVPCPEHLLLQIERRGLRRRATSEGLRQGERR